MAEKFLPGYEQDIERDAGHAPVAGNRKVIIHTTETGPGSLRAVRDNWRGSANWSKGLSHFIGEGGRYVQLLPLDTCAYTSQNGGINANKAGCPIQIEIVHYAKDPFSDLEYETLGKWIADLMKAGIVLDLDACPQFYGQNDGIYPYLSTTASPVRDLIQNQFGGYTWFNGICGHQHLEGNSHWDPGKLDIHRVCDIARSHHNETTQEDDEEVAKRIYFKNTKDSQWVVNVFNAKPGEQHIFRYNNVTHEVRHVGPREMKTALLWKNDPSIVWQGGQVGVPGELTDDYLDGMTLVPHDKY